SCCTLVDRPVLALFGGRAAGEFLVAFGRAVAVVGGFHPARGTTETDDNRLEPTLSALDPNRIFEACCVPSNSRHGALSSSAESRRLLLPPGLSTIEIDRHVRKCGAMPVCDRRYEAPRSSASNVLPQQSVALRWVHLAQRISPHESRGCRGSAG